ACPDRLPPGSLSPGAVGYGSPGFSRAGPARPGSLLPGSLARVLSCRARSPGFSPAGPARPGSLSRRCGCGRITRENATTTTPSQPGLPEAAAKAAGIRVAGLRDERG